MAGRAAGWPGCLGAFLGATVLSSLSTEDAALLMAGILLAIGLYVLLRFSLRTSPKLSTDGSKLSTKFLVPLGLFGGFIDASVAVTGVRSPPARCSPAAERRRGQSSGR